LGSTAPASNDSESELRRVGAERGESGGDREDRNAGDEDRAASEAVTECDGHQDQAGEGKRVGVDEPLQFFDGRAEVLANHRKRVRHDEVVEGGHEEWDASGEHREHERNAADCGRRGHDGS
jgi:hypothetical protein